MQKVISTDGTQIAYDRQGHGPAVILVDGALCYRSFGPMQGLAQLLAPDFTVITYDRRGRGDSGDTLPYAVEREVEDLDALIKVYGSPVCLYGLSSGGGLVLEAAIRLGPRVNKLAIYEVPFNFDPQGHLGLLDYSRQLDADLAAGDRGGAVARFMQYVGNPAAQIDAMRLQPVWPVFEAIAPTLAYDSAMIVKDLPEISQRAAQLTLPVLVMNGGAGMPFMQETALALSAVIPHARHLTLDDQTHAVKADVVAPVLAAFFKAADDSWLINSPYLKTARAV